MQCCNAVRATCRKQQTPQSEWRGGGELGVGIRLSSEVNPYEDDVSTVFSI